MIIFQDNFPTEKNCKELIINLIKDSLSKIEGKTEIDENDLNLILDEALINAMEHGNRWDPEKDIMIRIIFKGDTVEVIIEDEGDGFDYCDKKNRDNKPNALDLRGRGIFLINKLSNTEWINKGNTVKINIPVDMLS